MNNYKKQSGRTLGEMCKWFETERGEQAFTDVLRTSRKGFVRKYSAYDGETDAEELGKFHHAVSVAAHKAQHLLFSLYNLSAGEMPAKAGILADLPNFSEEVVSYSELFGCMTNTYGGLDLFSPAAYFADLLRIVETYITPEFDIPEGYRLCDRRPDLYTLPLTRENTETLLPYTDIIIERLIATLSNLKVFGDDTDESQVKEYCAENVYPAGLPYAMPYKIVAAALNKDGYNPARLLTVFKTGLPARELTAAVLGISVDYLDALIVCNNDFYPELDDLTDLSAVDADIVMRTTGLDLDQLDILFRRGIENTEEFKHAASGFYINQGLTGCLEISGDAKSVTGLTKAAIPNLIRFVRAAKLTGLTYDQLDAIIVGSEIDSALSLFSYIQAMSESFNVLLPLVSSLYDYGQTGTFREVYGDDLSIDKTYDFSVVLPAMAVALGYSENDIGILYSYLFPDSVDVSADQWNALYRNTYMAKLLGVGVEEYIIIAGLAGINNVLLRDVFSEKTISGLLAYKDLCAMNAYEVNYICTGTETSYASSGMKPEDFEKFTDNIKIQTDTLSEDKKNYTVEQELTRFLGIDSSLAEILFGILPNPSIDFHSWHETFYKDDGKDFAYQIVKRLSRANLLLKKIPLDIFVLFAKELFTDDFAETISYYELAETYRTAKYYSANPVFFMLIADAFAADDNRAMLAELCSLSEEDIDVLINPIEFSMNSMLQFVNRLDAVKTINISVAKLMKYLDALTKENGYQDLLSCTAGLTIPSGIGREYCSAVTALTIHKLRDRGISTPDGLSDYLLLDVQTDDAVKISYIREGINAVQTYLNRCRTGLEPGVGRIEEISEDYWSWIMNYSEWEANRMVFVEPENYLLPDIRSSQSVLFKNALQSVAGKPLDLAAAESLYAKYLDDYAELSNIIPCASYLASAKDSEQLYLFGRAQTQSGKLYYCIRKDGIWGEWTEISASIPVTDITPIFIFGKLFIFWLEKSSEAVPEISYKPAVSGEKLTEDTAPQLLQSTSNVTKFSVKYTYRNLLGNWNTVQTLFSESCVIQDSDTDYGKQFKNAYDTKGEGYRHLTAFRITERNFCDPSGRYYISQNSEFEKLLIMFGGFVYNFPNDIIENYYPLGKPFETQDKADFSRKHASICDKINILSRQNISGRLCSGSVHIYGSTLREETATADGEFLIFDEYTGGVEAAAPAVAIDESSTYVSTILTADVLKDTLCSSGRITPKFAGKKQPEYEYKDDGGKYSGEFCDTLNTYVLGTNPSTLLQNFQSYLKSVGVAEFSKPDKGAGTVRINRQNLSSTTFYASSSDTGIYPAQFSDLYSILLQCLGSQNLFGNYDNRLAANSEIIKTINLAGGFILKTGGKGGESFLLTPVPVKEEEGKPAQLPPTDSSIVISYPKITADDIEDAKGTWETDKDVIFNALYSCDPPIIDIDGYIYMPNVSEENISNALQSFGTVTETVVNGLFHLLNDRRLASSCMFWAQNVDHQTSTDIFNALTDNSVKDYTVLSVDTSASMNINPKVKLRSTEVIGTNTPSEVSGIFSQYVNAPLPVSLRFRGNSGYNFDISAIKYDVTRLTNSSLPYIISDFSTGGVDAFLKLENQQAPVPAIYPIERFAPNINALNLPSALDGAQPDFEGLYKNYNYELFYHLPVYAAKTLRDFGNYADAKKWMEYIYSPLAIEQFIDVHTFTPIIPGKEKKCIQELHDTGLLTDVPGKDGVYRVKYGFCLADFENTDARSRLENKHLTSDDINNVITILCNNALGGPYGYCWKFFPFRSRTIEDLIEDLNDSAELRNYHNNPFDPHAIASLRIGAYEKYTVLEYVDLLVEWGDSEFAKLTWDSVANASSLYSIAGEILGKRPAVLSPRESKDTAKCFDDLFNQKNDAQTDRITRLFNGLITVLLKEQDDGYTDDIYDMSNTEFFFPYFKIPVNTAVLAKWDIVADRLEKIRSNLDINGNPRNIPLFPAAANPLELARTRSAGSVSYSVKRPDIKENWYRYSVLYSYAKEFTSSLIQFSAQLLSSIEKGDEEMLRVLSAQQNTKLTMLSKQIRSNAVSQLDHQKEALDRAKDAAQKRYDYYNELVDENISPTEKGAIFQYVAAGLAHSGAIALAIEGGIAALTPDVGSPFAMVYGGRELSQSLMNYASAFSASAQVINYSAGVTEKYATYARRLSEWKFQREQAQTEMDQIDEQLAVNSLQREAAIHDQENADLIETHTAELIDYYQTKFSSCSLYNALSGLLRQTVFNSYQTAIELAARAEAAWQEETDDSTSFLTYTYWDDAKCGLLSGETLMNALDAMQAAYIAKPPRRLEITKIISLADACPEAFAQLQNGNMCCFTLPLSLFDDEKKPAHRLHKIRSLFVSTQVDIGAYQNICAKLTQTGSVILTDPNNQAAVSYVAKYDQGAAVPDGVLVNRRAGQSINISGAQNESGMHFYDPSGEAYLPFEGTGAVSQWCLEFGEKNPFNPTDISDIILNIEYTALESGKV